MGDGGTILATTTAGFPPPIPTITTFTPASGVVDTSVAATGSTRPP